MTVYEEPLETLALPTRMMNVATRLGLATVGDLARRHPAGLLLERNLGRSTVKDTRAALERALGMRWEDAAADFAEDEGLPASSAVAPETLGWEGLAVVLPEELKARAPSEAPLPPRLLSFAEARGIVTLGQLVAVPKSELHAAPRL